MITYFLSKIENNDLKDAIVGGVAIGLAAGLAAGLVAGPFGLAAGVAIGLFFGLFFGLVAGLTIGLAFGLAFGLVAGLADIITKGLLPFPYSVFFILLVLAAAEVWFYFDKSKPDRNDNVMLFTLWKKGESILEVLIVLVNAMNVIRFAPQIISALKGAYPMIMQWIGYLGVIMIALSIIYGYIYLNSLRYRNHKRHVGRPRKDEVD